LATDVERLDATAYLAAEGFDAQLLGELSGVLAVHGRLVLALGPPQRALWAQNVWLEPVRFRVASVTDAARKLRAIQRNWALYVHEAQRHRRRAALVQSLLPHVSAKPLVFPAPAPSAPLGSWTLLERDTVLASARCSSPFPHGEARFVEDHTGPPARAYLKLWEALTLLGSHPQPGDRCLDAGSSPGGWAWALSRLGARVLCVDRAPLDPAIAAMPGIESVKASAFSVQPATSEPFDWIFSDVVCYPKRLWTWVERWLRSGKCRRFVCTLKFQGTGHYGVIERFAAVPGSRIVHLHHNKHELTWMLDAGEVGTPLS
jgi:23S rRNA (cytidine2498-2'-O)-methyltransferase